MLKKINTFKGGYQFKNYIGQTTPTLIELPVPSKVIIPLRQGFSNEVKPLVKIDDKVFAGQIIGRDDSIVSTPVHSSVNGIVEDMKRMNYFKRDITMIVIRSTDSSKNFVPLAGHSQEWSKLSNEKIEELIYLAGVSSLDKEGIPTRFRSSVIMPADVEHLIVHGVGSEPYNISLETLIEGRNLLNFFEGIKILKKITPNSRVHLAVNNRKKKIIEQLVKLSSGLDWLDVYPLEPKYPQGYDEMLIPTILNKKFPHGYSAANIGIVVLNIQAVLGVYMSVVEGKPLIERIIALCGPSFKEDIHLKVRVGTSLADIIQGRVDAAYPHRLVLNSLLTGFPLNDIFLPVDRTFSHIVSLPKNTQREFLAFLRLGEHSDSYTNTFFAKFSGSSKFPDTNVHGEERPCISCGFCEGICPVQIIPHLLSKYVKGAIIDERLMNYEIFKCIECGLCTFICPSKIPLLKHIKEGMDKLIMQGCDHYQCIRPYFNLKGIEEYRGVTKL